MSVVAGAARARSTFPWSAVIGQERLKLALLLCAIDPGIGGVLVRGPRGVAKTTLARAFAELLPGQFVELPLGATEERVTGTLDLGKVLQQGQVEFSPGLLARAHQGVLYVDEVNLLPDPLVDLLLDAAASGSNVVERDGVSHAHPARFVLIGTMNPEEGELRPQLVDRFGLSALADGELAPPERSQIVLRRLEFEQAPERFVARFEAEQRALRERCARARERAATAGFAGPGLERVAQLCHAAGVEGVRADLAMLRAARAHALWHEREQIELEDVEAVAELALAHRRKEPPRPPKAGAAPPSGAPPSGAPRSGAPRSGAADGGRSDGSSAAARASAAPPSSSSAARREGVSGALPPVPVRPRAVTLRPVTLWPPALRPVVRPANGERLAQRRVGARLVRRLEAQRVRGGIDWVTTLLRAPRPTLDDLRYRLRPVPRTRLWILALDCSSSMLHNGALALAKGVASALAERAIAQRAQVALLAFAGESVQLQIGACGIVRAIAEQGGGGGTPLRSVLLAALALCRRPGYRGAQVQKRLLLLSDGRTPESVSDLRAACRALEPSLIDCERGAVRLGRARALAAQLGAGHLSVDQIV
ncbi:MAG TPA: ATP-binding protein [Polyangiaceae bacterium]|nr:ATP-binding protein [Polyangiaceae bacterium]